MHYDLYINGGYVRDSLMGIESSDIDYTAVIRDAESYESAEDAFSEFVSALKAEGYKVFLETPSKFTVRAKRPSGPSSDGVYDFVLSRKESGFIKGTRSPEFVELGSLEDDLRRRDFTCNALAQKVNDDGSLGPIIDMFDGVNHIKSKTLKTPISAEVSFNDDPLRILRAYRFSITKGFDISPSINNSISKFNTERFIETISTERVREELYKMFMFNTYLSLSLMEGMRRLNPELHKYIFNDCGLKMIPTTKGVKHGKSNTV